MDKAGCCVKLIKVFAWRWKKNVTLWAPFRAGAGVAKYRNETMTTEGDRERERGFPVQSQQTQWRGLT